MDDVKKVKKLVKLHLNMQENVYAKKRNGNNVFHVKKGNNIPYCKSLLTESTYYSKSQVQTKNFTNLSNL